MKKIGGLLAVCITASLTLSGCGLYDIADLFSGLGKGSAQLYVNEELQMPVDGEDTILPGAAWLDTDGNSIQAHGGQIQLMSVPDGNGGKTEKYVWVGEDKSSGHFGNDVAVYTSDDLYHWEFQGDVLRAVESRKQLEEDSYFQELYQDYSQEELDEVYNCINKNTVIERPKMLYNEKTDKYVIWFHSDDSTEKNSYKYDVGMAGVAISDSLAGPFRFLGRYRLSQCPKGQIDCFPSSKGEARDMNLFKDDDGIAYIAYTSENNKTMYISKLRNTHTCPQTRRRQFTRKISSAFSQAPCGKLRFFSREKTGGTTLCPPAPQDGCPTRRGSGPQMRFSANGKTTETLAWEKMETLPLTPRAPAFSRRNPVSGFTSETAGTARIWQIPDTSGCLLLSTAIR